MKHLTLILTVCYLFSGAIAWGNDTKTYSLTTVAAAPVMESIFQYSTNDPAAASQMYFDTRTGHKYVKNGANSYAEYSKRGRYLKTVPSNLPLLVNNSCIHPITQQTFILYKKGGGEKKEFVLHPGSQKHPSGYECVDALVSLE
ncbi:hypothetical protein [Desulfobacula sp.]|uniref:hypothetical protein n=1 Tax=Desulfobacula sp. TaxID=2593537 RepID=UPI002633F89A|nr:hypothetical protein [Desulfobacula sp.]